MSFTEFIDKQFERLDTLLKTRNSFFQSLILIVIECILKIATDSSLVKIIKML